MNASTIIPDPKFLVKPTDKQIVSFWRKVDRKNDSECWNWLGAKDQAGYGKLSYNRRAHRFSFYIHNGHLPSSDKRGGFVLMHTCDNPSCVNPAHLRLGSQSENMKDAALKNRTPRNGFTGPQLHPESMPRGDNHWSKRFPEKWNQMQILRKNKHIEFCEKRKADPTFQGKNTKITKDIGLLILYKFFILKQSQCSIAKEFGFCRSAIERVIRFKGKWSHVKDVDLTKVEHTLPLNYGSYRPLSY